MSLFCCPVSPCLELLLDQNRILSRDSQAAISLPRHLYQQGTSLDSLYTAGCVCVCVCMCSCLLKCAQTAWRVWWCDMVAVWACGATWGSVIFILLTGGKTALHFQFPLSHPLCLLSLILFSFLLTWVLKSHFFDFYPHLRFTKNATDKSLMTNVH